MVVVDSAHNSRRVVYDLYGAVSFTGCRILCEAIGGKVGNQSQLCTGGVFAGAGDIQSCRDKRNYLSCVLYGNGIYQLLCIPVS